MQHTLEHVCIRAGWDAFKEIAGDHLAAPGDAACLKQRWSSSHNIGEIEENALDTRVCRENVRQQATCSPTHVGDAVEGCKVVGGDQRSG